MSEKPEPFAADGEAKPPQHRHVTAPNRFTPARSETGPIALLPKESATFRGAVEAGGGVVAPVGADTRGLMWLSSGRAEELAAVLREHPGIGWIQLPWAGVDAFSGVIAAHPERVWTSAKGAYAEPVAEHALLLALALLRVLPKRITAITWGAREEGRSLYRRRVTIVGAGGIARELLRLLAPFDVDTTVVRKHDEPLEGANRTTTDLHGALLTADVVILAAAHTEGTSKLIGATELALMKRDAVLVNIARGGLVDTDALVAALNSGELAGAAVDVTDPEPLPDAHPLWNAPNTIVTPHVADTPEMTAPLLADRIAHNVRAWLGGGEFLGVVDPWLGY